MPVESTHSSLLHRFQLWVAQTIGERRTTPEAEQIVEEPNFPVDIHEKEALPDLIPCIDYRMHRDLPRQANTYVWHAVHRQRHLYPQCPLCETSDVNVHDNPPSQVRTLWPWKKHVTERSAHFSVEQWASTIQLFDASCSSVFLSEMTTLERERERL